MYLIRHFIFLSFALSLLTSFSLSAQSITDSLAYTYDFKFNDGIFLNFEQVKSNNAIPKRNVISRLNINETNFLKEALSSTEIKYFYKGQKQTVRTRDIWGYSSNGILYINYNDEFYRVPNIGSISMFVALIEQQYVSYSDPWNRGAYNYEQTTTQTRVSQFLINFKNGTIYAFDEKNIGQLIYDDESLFQEFSDLKRRKRRQLAFSFVKRYNQKHPLYFPKR